MVEILVQIIIEKEERIVQVLSITSLQLMVTDVLFKTVFLYAPREPLIFVFLLIFVPKFIAFLIFYNNFFVIKCSKLLFVVQITSYG